jgi:phenylalanyl-tRNA synthetase beta chain
MNIKILDSWLKEFLKTKATPQEIAKELSLTSVSIERIEKYKEDYVYDIEVTTNRPDLAAVVGLAREASAVLPQFAIHATFEPPKLEKPKIEKQLSIEIENDPTIVNRVCAVVMEVTVKESPQTIKDRLEASDIRSLNNLIDITNYVMRTIGHPTHVFDYDRLNTKKLKIRKARKGEEIVTLDKKRHVLPGGDIVAENNKGEIVDLLGIMGLENSVVTHETKRILFFLDNNDPVQMRKTSMSLGIRSEAVQMNEKGIDPELAMDALLYGISLYEKHADGKVVSEIIDIYPNKPKDKTIHVSKDKIDTVVGIDIPLEKSKIILENLGFPTTVQNNEISVKVPSFRSFEVEQAEDIIEEIARVYGYHNLPSVLPPVTSTTIRSLGSDVFYWEKRVKEMMKYWGYTETYTYSAVSETLFEGPIDEAVTLRNSLDEDHVYMRKTLVPSLLQVIDENKAYKQVQIFEIANVYAKNNNDLPSETRMLAGILKKPHASFFEIKGLLEQLTYDLGIKKIIFKKSEKGIVGADIYIGKMYIGEIEVLSDTYIDFEINFEMLIQHATLQKTFIPLTKFPPIIEDITFVLDETIASGDVIEEIKNQSPLVAQVSLLDKFNANRTFHILYQDPQKNLTNEEVAVIREKIIESVTKKFQAHLA